MRYGVGEIEEGGLVFILYNELSSLRGEPVMAVPFDGITFAQIYFIMVSPQPFRVVRVGMTLTVVAVEKIESLIEWIALAEGVAKAPLADTGCGIIGFFELFSDCYGFIWDG